MWREETVNQGPHRGDAGPSSIKNDESDSESWRKFLNRSSSTEGNAASHSTAKPSPSALDQKTDELFERNLEALKTSLGEGERISEVRETIKDNFDVKTLGEAFELIQNLETEVKLN